MCRLGLVQRALDDVEGEHLGAGVARHEDVCLVLRVRTDPTRAEDPVLETDSEVLAPVTSESPADHLVEVGVPVVVAVGYDLVDPVPVEVACGDTEPVLDSRAHDRL